MSWIAGMLLAFSLGICVGEMTCLTRSGGSLDSSLPSGDLFSLPFGLARGWLSAIFPPKSWHRVRVQHPNECHDPGFYADLAHRAVSSRRAFLDLTSARLLVSHVSLPKFTLKTGNGSRLKVRCCGCPQFEHPAIARPVFLADEPLIYQEF